MPVSICRSAAALASAGFSFSFPLSRSLDGTAMEKFLMSSPTQLSQFPDTLHVMDDDEDIAGSPAYDDVDYAPDIPNFYDQDLAMDMHTTKHFDGALLAPFALNSGSRFMSSDATAFSSNVANHVASLANYMNLHLANMHLANLHSFHHLRNVSLDDYRGHRHLNSTVSANAEPPSGTFSHSYSNSTIHLMELMPQLSLLALNPLLLDSPYSAVAATPGRRQKSGSISSHNFTTPLRGHSPGVKVSKTPHLIKNHRRNRLRVEPGLSHLLATIANMKSGQNSLSNPFEASFTSPKMGDLSDYDTTPLATPAKNQPTASFFTPISHNQSFGGSLDGLGFLALLGLHSLGLGLASLALNPGLALNLAGLNRLSVSSLGLGGLRRNDTWDSIKIEDQDDDACKQLRKAKSFTTFEPNLSRAHSTQTLSMDSSNTFEQPKFKKSASIDLLLPEFMAKDRRLRSYPASIDLASITNSSGSLSSAGTELLLANSASKPRGRSSVKAVKTSPAIYPTPSQIQETSATEEIAKFAESILNSDLKRPIIVQPDSADTYDPKKKHKCPLCLARFQRPEHVKRHLKSHSSEKPFQCDEPDCGRRFNRKDNLKAHLKKIHGKNS